MDPKEIVRIGYDAIGARWAAARPKQPEAGKLLEQLMASLPKGAWVLDVGCGDGVLLTHSLSHHCQVVGVDISRVQLDSARENVPSAEFFCQDMTTLALPDASFDAIVSYYAIIHVPREEHPALLANLHRMLKPSGRALLCMGMGDLPGGVEDNFLDAKMYWSHFDQSTNLRMLSESRFKILGTEIVGDSFSGGSHLFALTQQL